MRRERVKKKKKPKKERVIEVKKVVEEWKIWDKKEKVAKSNKRPRNWFLKGFTNESMFLERKQVRGYQQRSCKTT